MPRFSLGLGMLLGALVLGAVVLTALAIISVGYYYASQSVEKAAAEEFSGVAMRSAQAVNRLEREGKRLALALADRQLPAVLEAHSRDQGLLASMTTLMSVDDGVFSLFAGYPNGDYLELSNLDAAPGLREAWGAEIDERWVIVNFLTIDGRRREVRRFLDARLQLRREETRDSDYYASERPWYASAQRVEKGSISVTPPYLLSIVKRPGLSFSLARNDRIVVGSILLLSSLNAALEATRYPQTQHSLILNEDGIYFDSAPTPASAGASMPPREGSESSAYRTLWELSKEPAGIGRVHRRLVDGQFWLAWLARLEGVKNDSRPRFIGFLVQVDEVMAEHRRQALVSLLASLAVLLLIFPIVFLSIRVISVPIRRLAQESDKVRLRAFGEVQRVPSRIREVSSLSASLVTMSDAIGDYAR